MSQTEGTSVKIGERTFTVYRFPPKMARRHILKITKLLGPAIGALMEAGAKEARAGRNPEEADVPLGEAIANLVDRVDVDYAEQLMDDCAAYTMCEPGGKLADAYDAVFLNEPGHQFKWWAHALKVQFADFLAGWVGDTFPTLQSLQGGLGQKSQNTSTG
jgi:hypothetical protein